MKEHAYYCYGIVGFGKYRNGYDEPQNPNLITMIYGDGKEYVFHKDQCFELMTAILGKEYLFEVLEKTKKDFDEHVKKNGLIQTMDATLTGHGFVMVTDYANYHEYSNGGQSDVVGISGIGLDGKLFARNEEELFTDKATYEEMYEYNKNGKSL